MAKLQRPDEITLSNGISVILQPYESAVASSYWWVRTGSADEAPKEAGFAHFLEHMLFKDAAAKETGHASTGRMARAIESLGGEVNAYTSFDQTVYHVTCAATHWEKIFDAFAALAKPQRFLKTDFDREREVILEELRKNEDSPGRLLFQDLFSATYAKHPYGRPVIGTVKTLKAATAGQLEAFYRRRYVSGNMGIVLVGPMNGDRRKNLLRLLEKHFGAKIIARRPAREETRKMEPLCRPSPVIRARKFDVNAPAIAFSFRTPELCHPDIPAMDLIASVLAMGELSRLYQRLFCQTSLATDVSGGLYVPRDPGMLYVQAEVADVAKIEQAAEELFNCIAELRKQGPAQEELTRVLVNAESERLYATQTADGMASRLGFARFSMGDVNFDREYLEELREVDSETMRQVAERYFDCRHMGGALMLPKADQSIDAPALARRLGQLAEKILPPASEKVSKKAPLVRSISMPEVLTRDSGLRVLFRQNPNSHVVSAHSVALGGLRGELSHPVESVEKDWGASNMMSLTWTKGTASKDANAIAKIFEGHAASIDGFAGRNTVGLQMTGLARDWNLLSDVFSEILLEPVFPDTEVDHSRRVAEDSVKSIADHSAQLCSKLFLQTLFEKHPYGHLTTGSLESLQAIRGEKLREFHRKWVRPDNLVVAISGAIRKDDCLNWLKNFEERLIRLSSVSDAPKLDSIEEEVPLSGPRWVEQHLGREQLHIIVGGLGCRLKDPERYSLRLLQTLLGGQSGRLFLELREKRSLAYSVSPLSFEGMERGYIGTYIACAPQKRDEALAGIRQVIETVAKKGPTEVEMKRAKEFYLGRRAMDLQSDTALAAHFGLEGIYKVPLMTNEEVAAKIEAISVRDIQNVCRKYYLEQNFVTSVVG